MILLDTSVVVEILRGTEIGKKLSTQLSGKPYALSTLTINELLVGVNLRRKEAIKLFIESCNKISVDEEIAYKSVEIEDDLRTQGQLIGKMDIFIAATSIVHRLPLLSMDKDFKKVKGLNLTY